MAGFSDYLEDKVLNHLRGTAYAVPAGLYIGLFNAPPTDAGGGTEVTTTIRSAGRKSATFGVSSGGTMSTSAVVDFGVSEGSATVAYFGIFDAVADGNLLAFGPVTTALAITPGINVSFPTGNLTLALD
jgi:hypothetical protein